MKVVEIGRNFDQEYISQIEYMSDDYFLDADILIIEFEAIKNEFLKLFTFDGRQYVIIERKYQEFLETVKRRNDQINQYLNKGGNLFVFAGSNYIYSFTALKDQSDYETEIDFLKMVLLNSDNFETQILKGQSITYPNEKFEVFFKFFNVRYEFVYSKFQGYPVAKIKNTDQVVSVVIPKGRGNVILLPKLQFYADDHDEFRLKVRGAKSAIINLDQELKDSQVDILDFSLPDWSSNYLIGSEGTERNLLTKLFGEQLKIQLEIESSNAKLKRYERLKLLLSGTGKPLEDLIEEIFIEFGYESLSLKANRDDLIIKNKNEIAVIEIKGVKGSAAEKNAAQLMKWVTNFYIENDVNPKGILIVNAFKDKPLAERIERAFPNQMMEYSNRMKFCLLTTKQLLELYLDFKANKLSFDELHKILFNTIGELTYDTQQIQEIK